MERYLLEEKIGEGCFGTVHRAVFVETGRRVALKRIPIARLQEGLPSSAVRELAAMQHLAGHPNILRLYEVFPSGSTMVLVTELCATDLGTVLRNHSALAPLPISYVKAWFFMALRALSHCHAHRILHRDIKPSNFVIAHDNTLRLGDFGLARALDPADAVDMTHEVATRWYRAPELLFGARRYGPAVDMWGAGCLLAELLRGHGDAVLFPGEGDIDQITKIFRTLGKPTEESWPQVAQLPDWDKIVFQDFEAEGLASRLPRSDRVSAEALDLLRQLLTLDPSRRISAADALRHSFFALPPGPMAPHQMRLPSKAPKLPSFAQVLHGDARRAAAAPFDPSALPTSLSELHACMPPLLPFLAPGGGGGGGAAAAAPEPSAVAAAAGAAAGARIVFSARGGGGGGGIVDEGCEGGDAETLLAAMGARRQRAYLNERALATRVDEDEEDDSSASSSGSSSTETTSISAPAFGGGVDSPPPASGAAADDHFNF